MRSVVNKSAFPIGLLSQGSEYRVFGLCMISCKRIFIVCLLTGSLLPFALQR